MTEPRTWTLTRKNLPEIDDAIDHDRIYAKGYFEYVDGRTVCVGLRIGTGPTRQIARYGDTITRHPNGTWTVTAA
ncbi:hypothetical protein [Streptomyces subrutilus]|uniref:hypothetical protein n=1 Tax=Streptomyces subrutilus TaxID=36818 RepID=UPI002E15D129|nr:hypothetical protein OG479_32775 [Streptomyces subrutilus]